MNWEVAFGLRWSGKADLGLAPAVGFPLLTVLQLVQGLWRGQGLVAIGGLRGAATGFWAGQAAAAGGGPQAASNRFIHFILASVRDHEVGSASGS